MGSFIRLFSTAVVTLLLAVAARAQATRPIDAAEQESKPAVISPAARAVLDEMRDAYGKLKSLELAGSVGLSFDAAGEKLSEKGEFNASFLSPGKHRHEMKDDLLIVSNGEKAFIYQLDRKQYITVDPVKDRAPIADMPAPVGAGLEQQNPSLLLAMAKDAGATLADEVDTIDRDPDVTLDGKTYQSLTLKSDRKDQEMQKRVLVDPKTHLLRQVTLDLKDRLSKRGVPQVNSAMLTIDYSKTVADSPVVATAFDWTPPSDAMLVKLPTEPAAGASEQNAPSMALQGKPAPDFSLKDLSGATVTLAAQKGSVVVIDFWATWCPPCVEGMPHLDKLNNEMAPRGLKAFAVNLRETKAQAQKFMDDKKLKVSVLLDTDGAVGDLFKVTGIPQTVVVGKDGLVKNVFIGYGPGSDEQLRSAVEAAMKQ